MSGFDILNKCIKDKKRGSLQIALDIIEASLLLVKDADKADIIKFLKKIIAKQSSMAVVINVCFKIISAIEQGNYDEIIDLKKDIIESTHRLSSKVAVYLQDKSVCTISYSYETYLSLSKSNCRKVYIGIGRPKKEGELFADKLKADGKEVILFEDNNYLFGAKACDVFLSGADAIFDDTFVNKSLTFGLCLFAKYFNKPFYVSANKYKYLPTHLKNYFRILKMPKSEITKKDIDVYNVYFEEIPLNLVSLIGG